MDYTSHSSLSRYFSLLDRCLNESVGPNSDDVFQLVEMMSSELLDQGRSPLLDACCAGISYISRQKAGNRQAAVDMQNSDPSMVTSGFDAALLINLLAHHLHGRDIHSGISGNLHYFCRATRMRQLDLPQLQYMLDQIALRVRQLHKEAIAKAAAKAAAQPEPPAQPEASEPLPNAKATPPEQPAEVRLPERPAPEPVQGRIVQTAAAVREENQILRRRLTEEAHQAADQLRAELLEKVNQDVNDIREQLLADVHTEVETFRREMMDRLPQEMAEGRRRILKKAQDEADFIVGRAQAAAEQKLFAAKLRVIERNHPARLQDYEQEKAFLARDFTQLQHSMQLVSDQMHKIETSVTKAAEKKPYTNLLELYNFIADSRDAHPISGEEALPQTGEVCCSPDVLLDMICEYLADLGVQTLCTPPGSPFNSTCHTASNPPYDDDPRSRIVYKSLRSGFTRGDQVLQKELVEIR